MFSAPGYHAIRNCKKNEKFYFSSGDVLVLFGELFARGYANGLVEAAEKNGMQIIRATVGRREKDNQLRQLNPEELALQPKPLINIPLEAGFDLETASDGLCPVDRVKDLKLSDWESCKLNEQLLIESRNKGRERFRKNVKEYVKELRKILPPGKNILFAHLMAGGVPRTKIIMPLMNRSVKGTGERFLSSEKFWNSDLGKLCAMNFHEVTAETFQVLIEETSEIREELEKSGNFVSYTAYGYHGTEVDHSTGYDWQTYTPYLQGWAKIGLEKYAEAASQKGIRACVYNCPEILTNSSSIFQGVEMPLYPLLAAFRREGPQNEVTQNLWQDCQLLLKPEYKIDDVIDLCHETLKNPVIRGHCQFAKWPQHNSIDQLAIILEASEKLYEMHSNQKELITHLLSEIVFASCGKIMLADSAKPLTPVSWIGHDVIARTAFIK